MDRTAGGDTGRFSFMEAYFATRKDPQWLDYMQ